MFWHHSTLQLVDSAQLSTEEVSQPPLSVLKPVHFNCRDETRPRSECMSPFPCQAVKQLPFSTLGTIGDVCPVHTGSPGAPQGRLVGVVVVVDHAVQHVQARVYIVYVLDSTGVPYIALAFDSTMLAGEGEAASFPVCLSFAIGDEIDSEDVLQMEPGRGELV